MKKEMEDLAQRVAALEAVVFKDGATATGKIDHAVSRLREILSSGPQTRKRIVRLWSEKWNDMTFDLNMLYRARDRLHVMKLKNGFWSMPPLNSRRDLMIEEWLIKYMRLAASKSRFAVKGKTVCRAAFQQCGFTESEVREVAHRVEMIGDGDSWFEPTKRLKGDLVVVRMSDVQPSTLDVYIANQLKDPVSLRMLTAIIQRRFDETEGSVKRMLKELGYKVDDRNIVFPKNR